jgi:uncharacterized membrane protein YkvA (DUF1232 family)
VPNVIFFFLNLNKTINICIYAIYFVLLQRIFTDMEKSTKHKWGIGLSILAALVYLLVPTDLVPDVAPAIGWIDDVIAILLALANALRLGAKIRKDK